MKIALVTTTINVPSVLKLYRRYAGDVVIFVACDKKTPDISVFLNDINAHMVWAGNPVWTCSELIGWNTVARRSVAILEALKWRADIIVIVDDDNIPVDERYLDNFHWAFAREFDGLRVFTTTAFGSWFDPGKLQFSRSGSHVVQRGFPMQQKHEFPSFFVEPVIDVPVGIVQGLVLGDPDTSAIDRLSQAPEVHQVSELARAGVVTDPRRTWAPLNSQNLAFRRELAPCFLMLPGPELERYHDIFAGLVAQWAMRPTGQHVKFGQPFVWQQRNTHDPLRDLRAEAWGTEHAVEFANYLDGLDFPAMTVVGNLAHLAAHLPAYMPAGTAELWQAWLVDCQRAMG